MPDGSRLCINCAKAVPGEVAGQPPPEAVLDSMAHLFCGCQCEGWYALKSNGSAYRRALFKLERGVCVHCRLDCHTLVKRLQVGLRGWLLAGCWLAGGGCCRAGGAHAPVAGGRLLGCLYCHSGGDGSDRACSSSM
jgi:hypothetical protein